jgi:pimeloyl-ACP methyl ester carboxylesterase
MPQIDANGIAIRYQLEGPADAPVVLFSNSLGTRLEMWDPQMPALTQRFRALRYDSRGHGESAAPEGPYTIELLAADAIGLLDALGLERVHFCGLSKGGMIGQMLGARHADRLLSLTLCSTACHMEPKHLWDERIYLLFGHASAPGVWRQHGRRFRRVPRRRGHRRGRPILSQEVPQGVCRAARAILRDHGVPQHQHDQGLLRPGRSARRGQAHDL